jgi:hypothetical protein
MHAVAVPQETERKVEVEAPDGARELVLHVAPASVE